MTARGRIARWITTVCLLVAEWWEEETRWLR